MNLAEMPSGLAFQIAPPGTVEWETDEIQLTADEILSDGGGSGRTEKRIAINDAENFLKQMLSDGPVSANDIFEQGKDAGVSKRTLQRAKKNLGVEAKRVGGKNGGWKWHLKPGLDLAALEEESAAKEGQ